MKARPQIINVTEVRWTQPSGKMGFQYNVRYASGRKVTYNWQKNLPIPILMFILSDNVKTETRYTEWNGNITKYVKYTA